jgi:DNA-nicking Smr family endonuclease
MSNLKNDKAYNREETWGDLYKKHQVEKSGETDFRGFKELFEEKGMRGYDKGEKLYGSPDRDKLESFNFKYPEEPEDKIDLHGQTVEEAKVNLLRFIRDSRARGMRFVIIVPGVGRNSPDGKAKLRPMAVQQLNKLQHDHEIRRYETAEPRHGGAGAIYVFLK